MERSLPCTMQMSQPEEGWLICMDIYGQILPLEGYLRTPHTQCGFDPDPAIRRKAYQSAPQLQKGQRQLRLHLNFATETRNGRVLHPVSGGPEGIIYDVKPLQQGRNGILIREGIVRTQVIPAAEQTLQQKPFLGENGIASRLLERRGGEKPNLHPFPALLPSLENKRLRPRDLADCLPLYGNGTAVEVNGIRLQQRGRKPRLQLCTEEIDCPDHLLGILVIGEKLTDGMLSRLVQPVPLFPGHPRQKPGI